MRFRRLITVVGAHANGEVGDVITGGVIDVPLPPGSTMYDKMEYFWAHRDDMRQLLLNEPRGKINKNLKLILPAMDARADVGMLIMESDEFVPMSGSNVRCVVTVLLETGMLPIPDGVAIKTVTLDTAAGLVEARASCEDGKVTSVELDNVLSFVFGLDVPVQVEGLGEVRVDLAWGGMIFALVKASDVGLEVNNKNGAQFVQLGEKIKCALREKISPPPTHPDNPGISGVGTIEFTGPVYEENGEKVSYNTVVVSPGRCDRSPCGTGTCARLAVLNARGDIAVGETFRHRSIIGSEFVSKIRGTTTVGKEGVNSVPAVLPTISGQAWITAFHQYVLDPSDPFPTGFRVSDLWPEITKPLRPIAGKESKIETSN